MLNIIVDIIFMSNVNVSTAFSVALGVAAGIAFVEHYISKKSEQKWTAYFSSQLSFESLVACPLHVNYAPVMITL